MTWLAETAMLAHGWRRLLMLLVAGAIAALSIAPLFVVPALFVGFPVLVWALDGAERRTSFLGRLFGPAFRIGFAFGLGYFIVAFHWLGAAFFVDGGIMIAIMPFAIVALAALIALFWGLGTALAHLFWSHSGWRILTLTTFLSAAEWARGHFFSGFPFDLLGYALTGNDEMMQAASLVGVYGLTFLAILLASTPALIWPADGRSWSRRLAPFFLAVLVIAAQIGWGNYRLNSTQVAERTDIKLRLIQPVVYEHSDWSRAVPADVITRLLDLSATRTSPSDPGLEGVTHLVWPESSLPFFMSQYPEALARIARALPPDVTLLTGAPREDYENGGPGYNSILAINSDGEIVASYDKSHLVPFGEYLPYADFFSQFGIRQFVPGANGWAAGDGRRLMSLPGTPDFLAVICYEAIFSGDLGADIGKAQFIFNITNDAWFDGSIGPAQHAHHARVRAVEEGLPLVRAANSGLTFLTDPLGRVTASLAPQQVGLLDVVPSQRLAGTPFSQVRYGPFLIALLAGLAIAWLSSRRGRA
ncbi:apolipoprotein N-acyltransferase [Youhaiella tibetensis]|uniref:Apolipoprotein N-acyltransferase n=1 Tax=Paradevosia tibetensis TaxID=1447062 RepID=A0A5B9DTS8_9HYPH|nr:apolipoprotein N-acyltransferase [Youhaiella tibetensis]QEE22577.1 apolipoprotein N-acyltransferase [Youhaiella tibetensis]GGF40909.1 apolipoprotein N-acyltransferase [Youhaiella tibetensis]